MAGAGSGAAGALLASLAGKVIVLDPGHNGGNAAAASVINTLVNAVTLTKPCDTTGTQTNAGYGEHAFTWDVANRLRGILQAAGATVILTRSSDTGVGPCVTERAFIGNRTHANVAISIHADGGPPGGYGFHVMVPVPVGPDDAMVPASKVLAVDVRDAFHAGTGEPYSTYLGLQGLMPRSDMGGLNWSTVPKVFIECANMRNSSDAAKVIDPAWRQQAAQSIAVGLATFLASP